MSTRNPRHPAFTTGSFLIFRGIDRYESCFYNDYQLRWESADLALSSLLTFLDDKWPGPSFFLSRAKRLRKIANQWLESGAGRVFWGEDHRHIWQCDETDGCIVEWPEDRATLVFGVKELLKVIKPEAQAFYQARSVHAAMAAAGGDDEDEEDDNETPTERRGTKRKRGEEHLDLSIRTKKSK